MDIGKTIRCYTVEPLQDPVPAPKQYSVRVPVPVPSVGKADPTLTPSIIRRISG